MMHARLWLSGLALSALVACGADGVPERPEPRSAANGITVGVTASAGISSGNP